MVDCKNYLKPSSRPLFGRSLCIPEKYVTDDTDENNLEPKACQLKLTESDYDYDLLIVTKSRLFAFFDVDNGETDKRGEIVEAVPQNADDIIFAGKIRFGHILHGQSAFLVLERDLKHSETPIINIGKDYNGDWSFPQFTQTVAFEKTNIKKFRFSQTFSSNYYFTDDPMAIWNEGPADVSTNPSLIFLANKNETIIDMDLVDCYNLVFILVNVESSQNYIAKLPGYSFDSASGYKYLIPNDDRTGFQKILKKSSHGKKKNLFLKMAYVIGIPFILTVDQNFLSRFKVI